jgi:hypothetical protein
MGHPALGRRILLDFLFDGLAQFGNRGVESIQQLQKIASAPARPCANGNPSSCCRPFSRHNRFLQHKPSLRATACSCSYSACAPAPSGADAITVAGDPGFPNSASRSAENDLPAVTEKSAVRPRDRSSAAYSFAADLRHIADPQLNVQLSHESFKLTGMSTGFHPNLYADSLGY